LTDWVETHAANTCSGRVQLPDAAAIGSGRRCHQMIERPKLGKRTRDSRRVSDINEHWTSRY
jgi:hypothetical protein